MAILFKVRDTVSLHKQIKLKQLYQEVHKVPHL